MAQGKKFSTKIYRFNRQIIEAIVENDGQSREVQIVIITRAFRILERVWKDCGSQEVWNCIKSQNNRKEKSID